MVLGVQDKRLRENFLREPDLSLCKAIDMAKAVERASYECKVLNNEVEEVNQVRKNYNVRTDDKRRACRYCGNKHEMSREKCPAFGKKCFKCNGENHFANVCRKANYKQDVNNVGEITNESYEDLYVE